MSTPIETNTEELQDLVNRVYNLPNIGGSGIVQPDLVIGVNFRNTNANKYMFSTNTSRRYSVDDISIESGSVAAVAEKLRQGLPVRVVMREVNFYNEYLWARGYTEASQVYIAHTDDVVTYPDSPEVALNCFFVTQSLVTAYEWSGVQPCYFTITFDITTGEPLKVLVVLSTVTG